MLGPLPRLYRFTVAVAAVLLFVSAGVWAALMLPYPTLVRTGASLGLGIGAVSAYLLVHRSQATVQPARARRAGRSRDHRLH